MKPQYLVLAIAYLAAFAAPTPAAAEEQQTPVSQCQAIAQNIPKATFASFSGTAPLTPAVSEDEDVKFTFLGHSTFEIETPGGIIIATDYNGWYRPATTPDVVTMNKAHTTHFTLTPDPGIKHVLHGWSDVPGGKADIDLVVGDAYIRNVPTDIRFSYGLGGSQENGNSIFIFEIAGLCIGHLGHLHYELTDTHYIEIGRLDIVMVPVDGGLTMGADSMSRVIKRLRSSLILPMHRRGPPVDAFVSMFGKDFDIAYATDDSITVSMRTLPKKPLIYVLQGVR
ncbi:L-ascorbate metabolism protein UlaG (beta-lactamase superfamily) [Rhizobium leguminosarum]|uniref:L-ascorbate metabolism protein UlaG (Beta-lactamase superfamily) n=1 Tax=Rhizobium leguminosarum TaxID=384 RepID=A0AAE2SYF7_RHILE|nr:MULTISPECIES: MBL fold metallo-hydrolase [Rhizobium]MBB4292962.1 L-ascorbate metabolism protein UlaG (beta-lactamase superfamily) [Rhizobium leguminosarum]MBB4299002.1 L-ascorbate metabolism protein UlaG (beta-lactamase superfamily) [Rhizobium leguminosarum]MBB4310501.1 L-ascorbate metabolism protein UlaG (beta-lactamase superfamily) [Rhizobium leguminosarum]MBB4419617.1 L-ascorbate metabolism protein UlaG (beta-lactamase superfamily) [Rhizobium leguminosarum]MBB4434763.1 L-ascorbate metabo